MLQSTRLQRAGHSLITEQHSHLSAVSSRFSLAHSLVCALSFHNNSVLPVMSPVCSVMHVQVGPFKVTVTVCAGPPSRWAKSSWVLCLLCTVHILWTVCSESVIVFVCF